MNKRQKLTLIFSILAFIGISLSSWALWTWSKQYRFSSYKNIAFGFSLKYPPSWALKENALGVVVAFISPPESALDIYQENVNIVIQDLPPEKKISLEDYSALAIKQLHAVFGQNITILESKPTYFLGKPAYKLVYFGKGVEADLKWMHVCRIIDSRAIQFTYSALSSRFDQYLSSVEKMISSFRLK